MNRQPANPPLVVAGTKVIGMDQATGRQLWSYSDLARRAMRIHVTNERVFVLDWEGNLHCLRLMDGFLFGVVKIGGSEATMLAVADRLYVFAGEKVTAVDSNGRVLWQTHIGFDGEWGLVGLGVPGTQIQPDFSRS